MGEMPDSQLGNFTSYLERAELQERGEHAEVKSPIGVCLAQLGGLMGIATHELFSSKHLVVVRHDFP